RPGQVTAVCDTERQDNRPDDQPGERPPGQDGGRSRRNLQSPGKWGYSSVLGPPLRRRTGRGLPPTARAAPGSREALAAARTRGHYDEAPWSIGLMIAADQDRDPTPYHPLSANSFCHTCLDRPEPFRTGGAP